MSTTNTGGSAFPCHTIAMHEGMTLRDYFAAKAMAALLISPYGEDMVKPYREDVLPMDELARYAYEQAGAMLEARK